MSLLTQLLRLAADGQTNAQTATLLHLWPHTVRKHLENIFDHLDVDIRAAAVARLRQLIPPCNTHRRLGCAARAAALIEHHSHAFDKCVFGPRGTRAGT